MYFLETHSVVFSQRHEQRQRLAIGKKLKEEMYGHYPQNLPFYGRIAVFVAKKGKRTAVQLTSHECEHIINLEVLILLLEFDLAIRTPARGAGRERENLKYIGNEGD